LLELAKSEGEMISHKLRKAKEQLDEQRMVA